MVLFGFAYLGRGLKLSAAALALFAAVAWVVSGASAAAFVMSGVAMVFLVLAVDPLRRRLVSKRIFPVLARMLPPLSDTEREAIDAGTVWWDGEVFRGRPDWARLRDVSHPVLTA